MSSTFDASNRGTALGPVLLGLAQGRACCPALSDTGRPVRQVGATTCGKPVGSSRFASGEWTYAVVTFEARNAHGEGRYLEGLAPTCPARDDVTHELGDPREASLAEAVHYGRTGRCSDEAGREVDRVDRADARDHRGGRSCRRDGELTA